MKELIKILDHPDNDYWSDVLAERARKIIDENPDKILCEISVCVHDWPENRQEHLAYILGDGGSEIEIELINILLKSSYESVVYRAKEALNEFNRNT